MVWQVYDYFTHKSGSKMWPSDDPDDSPFDTFTCTLCQYQFRYRMYGGFSIGDEHPTRGAERQMDEHLARWHRAEILS